MNLKIEVKKCRGLIAGTTKNTQRSLPGEMFS